MMTKKGKSCSQKQQHYVWKNKMWKQQQKFKFEQQNKCEQQVYK